MTRDETIALFLKGREAWNTWAQKMLSERSALEKAGLWAIEESESQKPKPHNDQTRNWMANAEADFSQCLFVAKGAQGDEAADKEDVTKQPAPTLIEVDDSKIDFMGFLFPAIASFLHTTFLGNVGFTNALFSGNAVFDHTSFSGIASFINTKFLGAASFQDINFLNVTHFTGASFDENINFSRTSFSGNAYFQESKVDGELFCEHLKFCGLAVFDGASFSGPVRFYFSEFQKTASFSNVNFSNLPKFVGAVFSDKAEFGKAAFGPGSSFANATFAGNVSFEEANFSGGGSASFFYTSFEGDARFKGVTFIGGVSFVSASFTKLASFQTATFCSNALFDSVTFKHFADFTKVCFSKEANFTGMKAERAFDMTGAALTEVPVFNQADFKQAPDLDDVRFPLPNFWRGGNRRLIAQYRALRRMAVQGGDYEREQMAFKGEIRSKRGNEHQWHHAAFWFGLAYDALSDFGRSISRPLVVWFVSLFAFAAIYLQNAGVCSTRWFIPCKEGGGSKLLKAITLSAANALPGIGSSRAEESKLFYACIPLPTPAWSSIIQMGQTLWSAVLIFLFLLAVRNQFKIK